MKLKYFLLAVFVMGYSYCNAQYGIDRGDKIINLGLGLGTNYSSGIGFRTIVPPVSLSMEYILKTGTKDMNGSWGVGGYIGYASSKYTYPTIFGYGTYSYAYKYSNMYIGPRGAFHYKFIDNLDTYAGLFLGFCIASGKEIGTLPTGLAYNSENYSGFAWTMFLGGRYFFNHDYGALLELGYGVTYINIGIAKKFRT